MKSKRAKYLPFFFLIGFFFSFGLSVGISANLHTNEFFSHSKNYKHLNEKVFKTDLNEVLIEENENEDEVEFDLALNLIPFFLEFTTIESSEITYHTFQNYTTKLSDPIYIKVCNFRI